nr:MAG TPA: hypothetical protein [Caudoviricetes sp.]
MTKKKQIQELHKLLFHLFHPFLEPLFHFSRKHKQY